MSNRLLRIRSHACRAKLFASFSVVTIIFALVSSLALVISPPQIALAATLFNDTTLYAIGPHTSVIQSVNGTTGAYANVYTAKNSNGIALGIGPLPGGSTDIYAYYANDTTGSTVYRTDGTTDTPVFTTPYPFWGMGVAPNGAVNAGSVVGIYGGAGYKFAIWNGSTVTSTNITGIPGDVTYLSSAVTFTPDGSIVTHATTGTSKQYIVKINSTTGVMSVLYTYTNTAYTGNYCGVAYLNSKFYLGECARRLDAFDPATNTVTNISTTSAQLYDLASAQVVQTPLFTSPANNSSSSTTSQTVSGTGGEPNRPVTVKEGSTTICTTTADASGNWACPAPITFTYDAHTLQVTTTNAIGNESAAGITKFQVVPTPTITAPTAGATTGNLPTITGANAQPSKAVTIKDGSTTICTTTANASGNWSCTPSAPINDGSHTIQATTTGNLGLESPASNTVSFTSVTTTLFNDSTLYGITEQGVIYSINPATGQLTQVYNSHLNDRNLGVGPLPGGGAAIYAYYVDLTGTVYRTDGTTSTPAFTIPSGLRVGGLSVAPNGASNVGIVALAGLDGNFGIWDGTTVTVKPITGIPANTNINTDIAFTPDGSLIVPTSTNNNVRGLASIDVATGAFTPLYTFTTDTTQEYPALAYLNGKFYLGRFDNKLDAFDPSTSALVGSPPTMSAFIADLAAAQVVLLPPTITSPANNSSSSATSQTVSGTGGQPNRPVTVKDGSTTICTTTADASGNWACPAPVTFTYDVHTLSVTTSNAIGSESAAGITKFQVVPTPSITAPAAGTTTGGTPTISGANAQPNKAVTVKEGATTICSATADASGNWSCTPSSALADGTHSLTATTTGNLGLESPASSAASFTVDATAPAAPVITTPAANKALNTATPSYSGTAEPGSTVTVSVDGTQVCASVATDPTTGAWACTPSGALVDGTHTVTATATDAYGNTSAVASQTFATDTIRPSAPVVTSPANGVITNTTAPAFSGTGEPGSTVTIKDGTTVICTATVDSSGHWSCTPTSPLSEGNHLFAITVTDAAGNISTSTSLALEVDLTAPSAPTIGTSSVTGDITPTIFGTAEPGSTVTVQVDGATYCTATVSNTGDWNCVSTTPLSPGTHTVRATATDAAGNTSPAATKPITIDTTQPDAAVLTSPAVAKDTTPTITGTAEPNGTVNVFVDGTLYCTTTADANGNWSCTGSTALAEGTHAITATVTDAAKNTSPAATQALVIDTSAPAAPSITSPAITNDTKQTLAGTSEPGALVTVVIDGITICTDTASGSGTWSCAPSTPLSEDPHTVRVTATDLAGNVSAPATQTLVVDSVEPGRPTITTPNNGAQVTESRPTIAGTGEQGTSVTVTDENGTPVCTTTVAANGSWSCVPSVNLANGPHSIAVHLTDAAGNVSLVTTSTFTIRSSSAPTIDPPTGGFYTVRPILSGHATPNATVVITIDPDNNPATDNSVVYTVTADAAGKWSVNLATATPSSGTLPINGLSANSFAGITAVERDAQGNLSQAARQSIYIGFRLLFPFVPNHSTT